MEHEVVKLSQSFEDQSGKLVAMEFSKLPFLPKRLYWQIRGNHAHKRLRQIFWLTSGTVEIELTNGTLKKNYCLMEGSNFLLVNSGLWRKLYNFSRDAVVLVLADQEYDETDYIHNWEEFLWWKKNEQQI
jgi:dTDP-4-dehydrorhamnose 3,5-epimerase-like enzyme